MNDPRHFLLGWASFGIAGVGGAYLGYRRNLTDQAQRRLDDVEDTIVRNKRMDDMAAKWDQTHKHDIKRETRKVPKHLTEGITPDALPEVTTTSTDKAS